MRCQSWPLRPNCSPRAALDVSTASSSSLHCPSQPAHAGQVFRACIVVILMRDASLLAARVVPKPHRQIAGTQTSNDALVRRVRPPIQSDQTRMVDTAPPATTMRGVFLRHCGSADPAATWTPRNPSPANAPRPVPGRPSAFARFMHVRQARPLEPACTGSVRPAAADRRGFRPALALPVARPAWHAPSACRSVG